MDSDPAFEWDAANRDHIAQHQVSPDEAEQVIQNDPLDIDIETVEGEERMTSIGRTNQGWFLVVVSTLVEARIRVITAFPAPKSLIDFYVTHKGDLSDGG